MGGTTASPESDRRVSKRKVSVPKRSARVATATKSTIKTTVKTVEKTSSFGHHTKDVIRFVGVSLAGGKSDKACVAVLEYYPEQKKIFLSRLFEKIKSDEKISGDLKIHELIHQNADTLKFIAFDTPWAIPNCMRCQLKCPGFESCREPHIEWMWRHQEDRLKKKRPKKLFTPYTQRCVELYLATEIEEPFHLHHAMGANSAPLLARAAFIQRRLHFPTIEVLPKLTLWRLGETLGLMKSQIKDHRAAFGGDESRAQFLQALNEKNIAFVYHQDAKHMVENNHAFEAFLCGMTAFLKYKGLTEPRPKGFPKEEDWIEFPLKELKVKEILS